MLKVDNRPFLILIYEYEKPENQIFTEKVREAKVLGEETSLGFTLLLFIKI